MARMKRTKFQRERDLVEIAAGYLRGQTQQNIVDGLNQRYYSSDPLSRQQVSYDIKVLISRWKATAFRDINERKAEELAKIDTLECEYWDAWERSQKEAVIKTATTGKSTKGSINLQQNKSETPVGDPRYLAGVQWCITKRCEILGLDILEIDNKDKLELIPFSVPAYAISPAFYDAYRDINEHRHVEYIFKGGRGSTKSSFTSEIIIELMINNSQWHALVTRQVKDTLRDSVFSQLQWAINYFGLTDKFRCITNPLEITYIPTGQKIYFRGGDDPLKIKSIKPPFGYINILWFEELDQFRGSEAVRSIVQSAIRGGDRAYIFKSFNPPRSRNNWVIKDLEIPKENRFVHHSDYLTVPVEWLGRTFIEEAEYLKEVNPDAYDHEYLGISTGVGGLVFENVQLRKIADEEIAQFDHLCHGLDWGYYPDPAHYVRCHYDAARLTLYIYGELRKWKASNSQLYDDLIDYGCTPMDTIIADSAEPKSIADFRQYSSEPRMIFDENGQPVSDDLGRPKTIYGPMCRGAEKGPDSVRYSMKWLQSLKAIVIDNERAPYAADEFLNYEYEQTKDGEYISEYPDENNHAIDAVRYATNLIWRRRGQ